jgi:hypothetical protein
LVFPEDIESPTVDISVDVMIGVDVYLSRLMPDSDRKL